MTSAPATLSLVATTAKAGTVFQAGAPDASEKARPWCVDALLVGL
jgi:hypothetical protein